ncbi:DUF7507 domain-containing protein [Flavobacterium aestivum]|uniref:DUF7507 domain-containing protein n=1 Tax=Flavobacterium aestivum TaxID=3003257 RepID=UPI002482C41F|nr:gliding motility-associated C-terminal domain-containing protein [Flavobacterium aestivum]
MLKCLLKFINQSKTAFQMGLVLLLFLLGVQEKVSAQNCTANAGGNTTICGDAATLTGTVSGVLGAGTATWTLVSGPTTPTIVSPNSLITNVTGMTADGSYVFKLSYPCGTGISESQVTITAHPRPASFTAGADVTGICSTTGTTPLAGVIPSGFTGSWQARQITAYEKYTITQSTNSSFSSTTSATPTFSLINKANHEVDPAYYTILTITSSDGVCSYTDEAKVVFCPNPLINVPATASSCVSAGSQAFIDLTAAPFFNSNTPNSAGKVAATYTLTATSQPAGANIDLAEIDGSRMYFSGANISGVYVFTIDITTCCGTNTVGPITYTNNGAPPKAVNFQPTGHGAPEQLALYSFGGSAGEVHCGVAGTSTPELFYFDLDPSDSPTVVTTITSAGILPTGASTPIITLNGAGTMSRSVSVDPGASGWKVGTYSFNVSATMGTCGISQTYYIHIADGNRPALSVPNVSICYPGSGASSATITLPAVYKGVVDPSYFQDFGGSYNFTVLSQPAGSGTVTFEGQAQRSLTSTSTVISNLTMPGDYVIRLTPFNGNGVGPFIEQEYACSGIAGPLQTDFTIHVDETINANAGANQTVSCSSGLALQGNSVGSTGSTGLWTVVSVPAGAATPTILNPTNNIAVVTGINTIGIYTFRWTITSAHGVCTSSSDVSHDVQKLAPDTPTTTVVQPTCSTATGSITVTNPAPSADIEYSIDNGGTFQVSNIFPSLAVGTYQVVVKSFSIGCNSLPKEEILALPTNCTDLAVSKVVDNATPTVGTNVVFTITATNNGPNAATGVSVADTLPAGYTFVSASPSAGTSWTAPNWTIGNLANGANATLAITATVNATGPYGNTATITGNETDINSANNTSTSTPVPVASTDLAVTKVVDITNPTVGTNVVFTITATNNGPSAATGVSVADTLPAGYTFVSASPSAGTTWTAPNWTIGNLANGANAVLTITATVNATGPYANTATITGTENDPTPANNTATSTPVPVASTDLAVTKVSNNPTPAVGTNVVFTITATNNGPSAATGVSVADTLPAGYTFVSASPSAGTTWTAPNWTIGNLANGANATLTITATVNATGPYANTATITGTENDPTPANNTSTSTPTPVPSTDLAVTKVSNIANPTVGTNVIFTITATNNGPSAATGVSVADTLPAGYTFVSASPSAGTTWTAPNWTIGNLANGANAVLTITATVNATGPYANTATITGTENDPTPANNTATSTPAPMGSADLAVTKTVNNPTPTVGTNVVFTITATNNGPSAATGVSVADTLPAGYTFVSAAPAAGTTWTAPNWTIGNLANGANAILTITATVNATGPYANTATITGTETDPTPANNTATSTPTPVASADLAVTKTVNNPTPTVGTNVIFTITATNNGPSAATGVSVADTLPAGYTFVSASPSAGTTWTAPNWTIGNLASGANAVLTITATVNATGPYANTATITGTENDPTPANNTATSTPTPVASTDLVVSKVSNIANPTVGTNVIFTITATNNGPSAATGVSVADTLPAGYTFVSATPSAGTTWTAPNWAIGNLANGANATLAITATVNATGPYGNTATITGTENDPTPANNTSTSTPTPVASTDLVVTKVVDIANPTVGTNVVFTITATNNGPSAATGVSVADTLPAGYTFVSATPSAGTSWTAPNWTIGNLANGANATLTITATVNATGPYANTATITGTENDPTPANNTSTSTPTPVASTDLAVTKVSNIANPTVGANVVFTITATNNGPSAATGVSVADTLPAGYTFVSASPSAGTTWTAPNWAIGNLANGANATLTITATVNAVGPYANTATITGNENDPTPANNTATSTPTPVASTDLAVSKVSNIANPTVGTNVVFTISATNNGPSAATGVTVADVLPAGYTFVSATPSAGTTWTAPNWAIGNLANGANATLIITATVNATGPYANTATITGNENDPTLGNNTSTSTPTPVASTDLAVIKTVDNANPTVGTNVVFTISATNNGPSAATGVTVADVLPAGYIFVSATPVAGTTWTAPNWTIGNLANGANAILTITATVNATGPYANTATITGNENDPTLANNTSTSTATPLATNPSITLVKTAVFNDENNDGYAQVGETITYNFTVTNTGDTALDKINITDPLPGITLKGGPISLSVGQSDSSSFVGVYALTQADINLGTVSNQAKVTGTDPKGTIVSDLSNDSNAIGDNPTVLPITGCVIEVFNALSPNGDGENDALYIRGIECYPDNTLEVYNRWGVLVYERDHYNNTDGPFKGISEGRVTVNQSEELPVGTYYYVIKYRDSNSSTYKKAGYLYINRK